MKNLFNSVELRKPKRNFFDLTHDVKLSFNMGELIPVCHMEVIPGDEFHIGCQTLLRFAPLVSPVMHRMDLTVHYFFVPYRIMWPNWENYITNTADPATGLVPVHPYIIQPGSGANWVSGCLADYLGIPNPNGSANQYNYSAFPHCAYQRIYAEYYMDQNLINPNGLHGAININALPFTLADGFQVGSQLITSPFQQKRIRAWEHDYFTSALPFAQKGPAVSLPLGDVVIKAQGAPGANVSPIFVKTSAYGTVSAAGNPTIAALGLIEDTAATSITYNPNGSLTVAPTLINDLRYAFHLQKYLERNARGGTRYIENILAHFGVTSSDKRLQRPEYICGMKQPIIISEIVNTGGDVATLPQGNMAGHGLSAGAGRVGKYRAEEHGLIMGIMSVMPKTAYQNGVPKNMLKLTNQFDYFWPEFANLGEQPVYNAEIFSNNGAGTGAGQDSGTFGYVPRYAEYKYMPSRVAGDFRTSLDFWHLGRNFTTLPALNQAFIECVPRTDIFAVTDPATQHLYCHILHQVKAIRLMPKFGTPGGL